MMNATFNILSNYRVALRMTFCVTEHAIMELNNIHIMPFAKERYINSLLQCNAINKILAFLLFTP